EELDNTRHCHRETPFPEHASPTPPTDGGSAQHSQSEKASAPRGLSTIRRPPQRRRNVQASEPAFHIVVPLKRGERRQRDVSAVTHPGVTAWGRGGAGPWPSARASAGSSNSSSPCSVQGGLTTIRPEPRSRLSSPPGATVSSARNDLAMPVRRIFLMKSA